MNIFYCITFLHFGAGRALIDLVKEAKQRGHGVTIAATKEIDQYKSQQNLIDEAEQLGIQVMLCDDLFTRNFAEVSKSADKITELFREKQFDMIHSHAAVPGFAAALSARNAYGRFLPHISTVQAWGPNKVGWMKMQDAMFLNNVDAVHSGSNDVKEYLIGEGVEKSKIHRIYNGYNFSRIIDLVTCKIDIQHVKTKPYRIGTVADLSERKGIKYLIEAIAKLSHDLLDQLEVIIIGDGPLKNELVNLVQIMNLQDIIKFIGYESNPYKYFKTLDLFVLPSLSEGLPVSLVEAMYLKVPVLTTNVQGNREVAGEGRGYIVPSRDSEELAKAIQNFFIQDLNDSSKTEKAFQWVVNHFNRKTCFDNMFALYNIRCK